MNRRIGQYLEQHFLAEEEKSDRGFLQNTSRFILKGIPLWRSKTRLVVPTVILGFGGLQMLLGIVIHNILYYDTLDWMRKVTDYGWNSVNLAASYVILVHKEEIASLCQELDRWWKYAYMEEETAKLKKGSEEWLLKFMYYCKRVILISSAFYSLLPCVKLYKASEIGIDMLIFNMWTPIALDSTLKFIITYLWQVVLMWFAFMNYAECLLMLVCFAVVISWQIRLVGIALITIEERVFKAMKEKKYVNEKDWIEDRTRLLDKELVNGVKHFQHLHRSASRMRDIFASMTNVTYQGGMWVMCSVGVKAATEMTFVTMVQAFLMIIVVLVSQYEFSFISECLIEEVQKLRDVAYESPWYTMPVKCRKTFHIFQSMLHVDRFPTLRTIMGTKTNMENLSKVINASYCYFSMIVTVKSS